MRTMLLICLLAAAGSLNAGVITVSQTVAFIGTCGGGCGFDSEDLSDVEVGYLQFSYDESASDQAPSDTEALFDLLSFRIYFPLADLTFIGSDGSVSVEFEFPGLHPTAVDIQMTAVVTDAMDRFEPGYFHFRWLDNFADQIVDVPSAGDWTNGITSWTMSFIGDDGYFAGQTDFAYSDPVVTVPEPSTLALLGVGLLGIWRLRSRAAS